MPSRKVLELRLDHSRRIIQFRLGHTPLRDGQAWVEVLESLDDFSPVAPAMEVAIVSSKHLGDQAKLSGPEVLATLFGKVERNSFEEPATVVPDPVAFWVLDEERDQKLEVITD